MSTGKLRTAAPRPEHLEPGEPVHRLDRRRPLGPGLAGGAGGRTAAQGRGHRLRHRLHLGAEARDPHAVDHARRDGPDVDAGRAQLAPERAPLRRAAGPRQGADGREARRRRRSRSGAAATTSRRRRSTPDDPQHPRFDRAMPALPAAELPSTESLKDTLGARAAVLGRHASRRNSPRAATCWSPRTATACARW